MDILAIDPGPLSSGFYRSRDLHGVWENKTIRDAIYSGRLRADILAVEMFEARGMPIGQESVETIFWAGAFAEAWGHATGMPARRIYRRDIKIALCGTTQAKDANIRQALIDIYGPPGTKKAPGGTYGVKSHAWAALAVWHVASLGD